jgi:hypothetical protein
MTTRKCYKCSKVKPLDSSNFHKSKSRTFGFEYKCKECAKDRKDRRIKRYESFSPEQKEKHYELGIAYRSTDKGRAIGLLAAYRKIDKKKGRECSITQSDILEVFEKDCVYCGFPATGFDRINNISGHVKENCVPCCKECNVARMDNFTHEETFILGETIRQIKLQRQIV